MTEDRPDLQEVLHDDRLLDHLAAAEHARWARWQLYIHEHCQPGPNGALIIPAELVDRWTAQIHTQFSELTDMEKESDRDQVRRYLPIIAEALREARPS